MSDHVNAIASRQAHLAMPASTASDASWLRDAIGSRGEVSVLGGRFKGDVCIATADVRTVPGLPAWSPPN
jgi:aromatic ring-cleaving dioxygenase